MFMKAVGLLSRSITDFSDTEYLTFARLLKNKQKSKLDLADLIKLIEEKL